VLKTIWKLSPLIAIFALSACNSGSGTTPGTLGTLALSIESSQISVGGSPTTVTATLTGVQQGTNPLGPITIEFQVMTTDYKSSNIATVTAETTPASGVAACTAVATSIANQYTCSAQLTGVSVGNGVIWVEASANNAYLLTPNYIGFSVIQ
jgi:hypothetical protein